jgi:hypothetical protein
LDDKEGKEFLLVGILETFAFNIAKVFQQHDGFTHWQSKNLQRG